MCKVYTEAVHSVALWTRVTLGLDMCKVSSEAVHSVALWTRVTLGLDMCKVCTEAVHCAALWTRVTLGLDMCKVCTEAVHSVALWTRVTLGLDKSPPHPTPPNPPDESRANPPRLSNMLPQEVHLLYCKRAQFSGFTYFLLHLPSIQLISNVRQGSSFLKRRKLSGKPNRTLSKTPTFPSAAASAPKSNDAASDAWHHLIHNIDPSLKICSGVVVEQKAIDISTESIKTCNHQCLKASLLKLCDSVGCKECLNQQGLTSMEGKAAINLCHPTTKKSEACALLTSKMNQNDMVIQLYYSYTQLYMRLAIGKPPKNSSCGFSQNRSFPPRSRANESGNTKSSGDSLKTATFSPAAAATFGGTKKSPPYRLSWRVSKAYRRRLLEDVPDPFANSFNTVKHIEPQKV